MERYEKLLETTVSILKSFNPVVSTVDSHADTFLGINSSTTDSVFVKQVFYGCDRYKSLLKNLLSSFYHDNSGTTLRSDYTTYMIFSYLALFRLDNLTADEFKSFLSTQDPAKTHGFLSYICNANVLEEKVRDEWSKVYDLDYIDNDIIDRIKRHKDEIEFLKAHFSSLAFGMLQVTENDTDGIPAVMKTSPTKPRPFNLTKPKPVKIKEPLRIPLHITAKPVPNTLNSTTLANIANETRNRRETSLKDTCEKYEKSSNQLFKFGKSRESRTSRELKMQIKKELDSNLNYDLKPSKSLRVPDFTKSKAVVRLNTTSILREDALYKRKQEAEAKAIKAYESELRDSTEFIAWQERMKKVDQEAREEQIERRRIEMKMSHESVVEAERYKKLRNHKLAAQMKLESKHRLEGVANEMKERIESCQKAAVTIKSHRESAPKVAKEKTLRYNKSRRNQIKSESKDMYALKLAQDQQEQIRRNDFIRQIRALERATKSTIKIFDPTESSGVGLLEEMSLVELKERLRMNKIRKEEELEGRRQRNLRKKQEKEADLKQRLDKLRKIRAAKAQEGKLLRRNQKNSRLETKLKHTKKLEDDNIELAVRLKEKSESTVAERERLKLEELEIEKKRLFLGAAKSIREKSRLQEQLKGLEREAREKQNKSQYDARYNEETKRIERDIKQFNSKRKQRVQKQRKIQYLSALEQSKQELATQQHLEMLRKKALFKEERQRAEAGLLYRQTCKSRSY